MTPALVVTVMVVYFSALLLIAYITSKNADTNDFFNASKQAPWYLVAFGMIGTSLSGVTFISVPAAVGNISFSYYQIVLGYVVGYFVIGTVLMPLYYRLNLVSIYTYLDQRFGFWSYKTGSLTFLISRAIGSSLRLYLAAAVLQLFLFDHWNIPFIVTVAVTIILIWIYTFRGGIKTIVWTDSFQTFFLVSSLVVSVALISQQMDWSISEMFSKVADSNYSQIFFFESFKSDKNFFKQFISGIFIAIVMTGLDQDLMQKNLSCKNIKDAQKNIFWFTIVTAFVNLLFLVLGALLYLYSNAKGVGLPERVDLLYPTLALNNFGIFAGVTFLLGIIASSYASSDSALTALTTSFCIDFLNFDKKEESVRKRQKLFVHMGFSVLFLIIIVIVHWLNDSAIITTVLKMASYTYGPLLGLFAFGLLTKRKVYDRWYTVPIICVAGPLLTLFLDKRSETWFWGYRFSFETLLVNGFLIFVGLYIASLDIWTKGAPKTDPKIAD